MATGLPAQCETHAIYRPGVGLNIWRSHGLQPHRHFPFRLERVDADDLPGAADARSLNDRQTDAAAAEHRHRLPRLEPRGAQRRPDAGQHPAADQRGAVERQLGIDLHQRILVQ